MCFYLLSLRRGKRTAWYFYVLFGEGSLLPGTYHMFNAVNSYSPEPPKDSYHHNHPGTSPPKSPDPSMLQQVES